MKRCVLNAGLWVFVMFLSEADASNAQSAELSLESLAAEALEKNPEVNFYKAEIAAAKAERKQAGAYPNPEFEGDIGRKRVSGGGVSAEGTAWSVSVVQPFEYPGRLALRKAIANRQIDLAEIGYEQFRAALAARVRALGFGLLIARQKAEAAQEVARRGQALADVLVQRDPAGVTPLLETRIIEASVITAKRGAAEASRNAQVALYELNQLRGAALASDIAIAATNFQFRPLAGPDQFLALAWTNSFDLQMRRAELEQQGFRVDLSKNERWPTVSIGPFYSEERAGDTERIAGVGVSVPVPLWNRNRGSVQSAEARRLQAETALSVTQRQVEREVRERLAAYSAVIEQLQFIRPDSLKQLRDAADLADRHYRLGAVPVSTYVELQEKYLEATEAILDLQREALEDWEQLRLLVGSETLPIASKPRKEDQ